PQLPVELAIIKICGSITKQDPIPDFNQQEVDSSRPLVIASPDAPVGAKQSSNEKVASSVTPFPRNDTDLTVFDSVPVISLDEVKQKWPEVYEQIKSCNASLPMMMQGCEVSGIEGEHVELGFEYGLYVEAVNQDKNRKLIEGVFEQVLGKRLRVKAVQKKPTVHADETMSTLLQEFGGSIV
ncbi:MAG: hypothetical protein NUV84_04795, partial [Candidatus Uhrbacteria bacterium]|nr:hypothetical protein [Candidatus Uhrbacteria bacterium]